MRALTGEGDVLAHLVGQRIAYTINRRWDIALNAHRRFNNDFSQGQFALGPEVGLLIGKNLNLGFGFNVVGFRDDDFAASGGTARGAFIRLRFKFDEDLLPGHRELSSN